MKLQFTMECCIRVNEQLYDVTVEEYKTVTKIYYKRVGRALLHNIITLRGKERNIAIGKAIANDLKK